MTHKKMMNWILSRTFLTNEPIYNLTLEIQSQACRVCVGVSYFSAVLVKQQTK